MEFSLKQFLEVRSHLEYFFFVYQFENVEIRNQCHVLQVFFLLNLMMSKTIKKSEIFFFPNIQNRKNLVVFQIYLFGPFSFVSRFSFSLSQKLKRTSYALAFFFSHFSLLPLFCRGFVFFVSLPPESFQSHFL